MASKRPRETDCREERIGELRTKDYLLDAEGIAGDAKGVQRVSDLEHG